MEKVDSPQMSKGVLLILDYASFIVLENEAGRVRVDGRGCGRLSDLNTRNPSAQDVSTLAEPESSAVVAATLNTTTRPH